MPILGLVLVLEDRDDTALAATRLHAEADLELGERVGHRWPAVLEAPSTDAVELRVEALRKIPGVAAIDVVYADFEDLLARGTSGAPGPPGAASLPREGR